MTLPTWLNYSSVLYFRCQQWLKIIGKSDLQPEVARRKRICSIHFDVESYSSPRKIHTARLHPTAIPTIQVSTQESTSSNDCTHLPNIQAISLSPPSAKIQKQDKELTENEFNQILYLRLQNAKLKRKNDVLLKKMKFLSKRNLSLNKQNAVLKKTQILLKSSVKSQESKAYADILRKLPRLPAALFDILYKQKNVHDWSNEKEAMELCLSLYFKSPAAYRVLRVSGFLLPHPNTLKSRYCMLLKEIGLCPNILELLRIRSLTLSEHEKRVTLSFDGMSIAKAISYMKHSDNLLGFVDHGEFATGVKPPVADQCLLLMIRGLALRWKQIIGFYVVKHSLPFSVFEAMIDNTIRSLNGIGLHVDVIVMDQESTQWRWVREHGISPEYPYILNGENKCFVVPDPPHLIKSLRNNLRTKDIIFQIRGVTYVAKWIHLKTLFVLQSSKPDNRVVYKWTEDPRRKL